MRCFDAVFETVSAKTRTLWTIGQCHFCNEQIQLHTNYRQGARGATYTHKRCFSSEGTPVGSGVLGHSCVLVRWQYTVIDSVEHKGSYFSTPQHTSTPAFVRWRNPSECVFLVARSCVQPGPRDSFSIRRGLATRDLAPFSCHHVALFSEQCVTTTLQMAETRRRIVQPASRGISSWTKIKSRLRKPSANPSITQAFAHSQPPPHARLFTSFHGSLCSASLRASKPRSSWPSLHNPASLVMVPSGLQQPNRLPNHRTTLAPTHQNLKKFSPPGSR